MNSSQILKKPLSAASRKVLACMEMQARSSFAAIAAETSLSEQLVKYHFRQARDCGFLASVNPIFDPSAIGYSLYLIYLSVLNVSAEEEDAWLGYCKKIPGVMVVSKGFGRWNALIAAWARTPANLDRIIEELAQPISGRIAEFQITTRLYSHYSSTQILSGGFDVLKHSRREPGEAVRLDQQDLEIIAALSRNARASASEISRKVKLSASSVQARIKRLEVLGVILGYRAIYRYDLLGYSQSRILLRLAEPVDETCSKIANAAFASGLVTMASRHLGFADLDLRCFSLTMKDLAALTAQLRNAFRKDIIRLGVVPLLEWSYANHFPIQREGLSISP